MEESRAFTGTAARRATQLLILVLFLVGSKRTFATPGLLTPGRDSRRPHPCTTNLPVAGPEVKAEHAGSKVPEAGAGLGSLARALWDAQARPGDSIGPAIAPVRQQRSFRGPEPFLTAYSLSSLSPPRDVL